MELTLIVRSAAELQAAVKAIVLGVDGALEEAKSEGEVFVFPPQNLLIRGVMVTTLNADTVVTDTDTVGASSETTLQTPPNRTTTRQESGGDISETDISHTEY